ncbi:hypothetical protein [Brevibacillus sp. MER 51]|uniref:hypothetical protein n=1 Tax=Brevibacillus sp. MER 51 TaxID=2939560 RepID=UPI002040F047|nr:hypothetical protein [Brevibacillus sp. MER 51]MCM3143842.1 hypothetical protein [Brevibacillus sp. MER 51]
MVYNNNPISRLQNIIEDILNSEGHYGREILGNIFNIERNDTASLYSILIDLIHLVRESRNQIERLSDNDIYLEPIVNVERAILRLELDSSLSNFKSSLGEHTLYGLKFSADLITRKYGEVTIDEQTIASIQQDVDALIEKLFNSNLPDSLRDILIEKLHNIRTAIIKVRITGIDGLKQALESSAGALFLHRDEVIKNNENEDVQGTISLLDKLNKIVSIGNSVKELVSFSKSLFLSPPE